LAPPIHLSPATELAERVLLPGDPQRALKLAQGLLESPRMFNTRRGLWGYTGAAPGGFPVTIQATGMGGPSAAIVVEELIELGARVLVRTGTCGALGDAHGLGDLVTATEVIAADGASRALGAGDRLAADPELTEALVAAGGRPATAVSTDLFYDPRPDVEEGWRRAGAAVIEMEAATVLAGRPARRRPRPSRPGGARSARAGARRGRAGGARGDPGGPKQRLLRRARCAVPDGAQRSVLTLARIEGSNQDGSVPAPPTP
jgi:uridine phosphorylase